MLNPRNSLICPKKDLNKQQSLLNFSSIKTLGRLIISLDASLAKANINLVSNLLSPVIIKIVNL